ncbi:MAG: hypothetical protein M3015_16505, partial [Bacteroidota bacterium]|nr:hypothetical protein [Bacteroidota bacterium]
MKHLFVICCLLTNIFATNTSMAQKNVIWKNDAFTIYHDSIVQGSFVAKALSSTEITSSYQSPANSFQSAAISFKFSINGKDNEMKSGTDHH